MEEDLIAGDCMKVLDLSGLNDRRNLAIVTRKKVPNVVVIPFLKA